MDKFCDLPARSDGLMLCLTLQFYVSCIFICVFLFLQDLASEEKKRLEEKQRTARKNRSKSEEDWKTRSVCLPLCVCRYIKAVDIEVDCQSMLVVSV